MEQKTLTCTICGKKLKDWYRVEGSDKYFCSLKHLQEWEDKNLPTTK